MHTRLLLLVLALIGLAGCSSQAEPPRADPTALAEAPRFRGVTLDLRREPPQSPLPHLARLGVRQIVLVPFAYQRRLDDPDLRFNPEPGWYSESATAARHLAAVGDSLGLRIVLKPQVWIGGHDDGWSADIGFETEDTWQRWEANYHRYVVHHARLAAEIGSPLFVIGTELGRAVRERPAFFRRLISDVRAVYPGPLTYAANWHEDYERVSFWDALDVVGVQAYFPLAAAGDTARSAAAFVSAWQPHVEALRRVHERTGKPIVFTEVGYRSVGYAAAEPWRWPNRGEPSAPDPALQAALYRAFFEAVWSEPWFEGAFIWKWTDQAHAPVGFAFNGKPAEAVLGSWFRE